MRAGARALDDLTIRQNKRESGIPHARATGCCIILRWMPLPVTFSGERWRSPAQARSRLIAIDGWGGAGKTTLSERIVHLSGGHVVHLD